MKYRLPQIKQVIRNLEEATAATKSTDPNYGKKFELLYELRDKTSSYLDTERGYRDNKKGQIPTKVALFQNITNPYIDTIDNTSDPKQKSNILEIFGQVVSSKEFNHGLQTHVKNNPEEVSTIIKNTVDAFSDPTIKYSNNYLKKFIIQSRHFNTTLQKHIQQNPTESAPVLQNIINHLTTNILETEDPAEKLEAAYSFGHVTSGEVFGTTLLTAVPTDNRILVLGNEFMLVNPAYNRRDCAVPRIYMANGMVTKSRCETILDKSIANTDDDGEDPREIKIDFDSGKDLIRQFADNNVKLTERNWSIHQRVYDVLMRKAVMDAFAQQNADPNYKMPKTEREYLQPTAQKMVANNFEHDPIYRSLTNGL